MGFDHNHMILHAEAARDNETDLFRIEVLNTMIKIVRSIDAKSSTI